MEDLLPIRPRFISGRRLIHWVRLFWVITSASSLVFGGASAELWVVDPRNLNAAEQALLASAQGNLNRSNAVLWMNGGGANRRIPEELRQEGWVLHTNLNVWTALELFRPRFDGFITCTVTNASLNVATALAGSRHALVADASLRARLESMGLRERLDVRELTESAAFSRFRSEFVAGLAVHQTRHKPLHLRDFAVARQAFTFFEVSAVERSRIVHELGSGTRVFGWGEEEYAFVREVSAGGGAVIPADWALNLSALQHLKTQIPQRPVRPQPAPLKSNERAVVFVVTDGDNLQWLLNGFEEAPGFWGSPDRGRFPITWELAPVLAELAPRVCARLYRTATTNDDFVAGPSGAGYWFPSVAPERGYLSAASGRALAAAQLNVVSMLNSGGGLEGADDLVARSEVAGVLGKDYAPYNRWGGAMRWHAGKPILSYRYLLWEQKRADGSLRPDWLPEGVAEAMGRLPMGSTRDGRSIALVNVHAWSFRDAGGPVGAIARTVRLLPAGTRVVTASELIDLMTAAN